MKSFTILASALAMLLPLTSAQTEWAISAFTSNDCDVTTLAFADEDDNAEGFVCHSFGEIVQSVGWNGDGFWCVDLYPNAECSDSNFHLTSGVSGCQTSSGGWGSFSLSIPDDGFAC